MKPQLLGIVCLFLSMNGVINAQATNSVRIRLLVGEATCIKSTENVGGLNNRDEVYLLVAGATPGGKTDKKLPGRDDYYEAKSGTKLAWTNQDQRPAIHPIIWEGDLRPSESATFVIHVGEQDGSQLAEIMKWAADAADKLFPEIGGAAKQIVAKIPFPQGDEAIGRIIAKVTNKNGEIVAEYHEALNATKQGRRGRNLESFHFGGDSGCQYNFSFWAVHARR
ncbi:MAG TPA: hypothetical protein VGE29_18625 [Prosthecobacter sp.]